MPKFTDDEKALLTPYVTNVDEDIFAVKGLAGIAGAVYARYSRAPGGFRETLLKEFIKEGAIDAVKAGDLIERVLIAYGDDSVGELEGAHVSFENISILATKEIEDRRIGGSPIEQSTRYVFYDQRDGHEDGRFRYFRDPEVLASPHAQAYIGTMDFIFSTYCDLIEPMKAYYAGLKPLEEAEYDVNGDGVKERWADLGDDEKLKKSFRMTYNADIRSKACDTLRALLPVATQTNVGIFGNGRFFQNVLTHCYSSAIAEVRDIAKRTHAELDKIIARFVKRAKANPYVIATRERVRDLAVGLFTAIPVAERDGVDLLEEGDGDTLMLAQMLYPHLPHSLRQIRDAVRAFPDDMKREIIATYVGERKSRRDRPGRAFESGYPYTFDLVTDFGTYKDLERHRMMTQQRQKFTPKLGFLMPEDLVKAGFEAQGLACVARAKELYDRLLPDFPEAASYATLHGSLVRWTMGINDRALMHLIELRTTPQGHPTYRKVCQELHKAVAARSPWRASAMRFADHGDYFWSRADSEARQRVKEAALDKE